MRSAPAVEEEEDGERKTKFREMLKVRIQGRISRSMRRYFQFEDMVRGFWEWEDVGVLC